MMIHDIELLDRWFGIVFFLEAASFLIMASGGEFLLWWARPDKNGAFAYEGVLDFDRGSGHL